VQCSVAVFKSADHECCSEDFFTSRTTDLTQSPQMKEATADNATDMLLHRQFSIEVDAEISYDRDRLDVVITE